MGRHKLFYYEPKEVRDSLRALENKAKELHALENDFIIMLKEIDQRRFFVRFGYRSLRTYMIESLQMTKTQAQRIITKMRQQKNIPHQHPHQHQHQHQSPPVFNISEPTKHDYRGSLRPPPK